jgi:hypothetical protein
MVRSDLIALQEKLAGFRFRVSTEAELQEDLEKVLTHLKIPADREFRLKGGPVDFRLHSGIAIECKINGSPAAVLRQVARYLEQPEISALLLVSRRIKHGAGLDELCGKPFSRLWIGRLT